MPQYFCHNERRRQAVLAHGTLNGIDYLEVLDQEAPPGSPRQQTLLVQCLKALPAGLTGDNVQLQGGVRITPVRVVWAARAADAATLFAAGLISAAERDFFLALPDPDQVLTVRTDSAGDFSAYRLCLVAGDDPLPGFDPLLAQVAFSFKVECPTDFDCKSDDDCPPEPEVTPPIDYLARDYASFRRLMLDRLAVTMPQWQEANPADMGIAVVEVLAYAADHLSYYQDAAATEAYLGTARRRPSVHRHARLLDYPMHEGCNARAWVCFKVDAGGDGLTLPGNTWHRDEPLVADPTRLLTRMPEAILIGTAEYDILRSLHQAEVFELMHDITLREAHNEIRFYTWGDQECCLPKGATQATIRGCLSLAGGDPSDCRSLADTWTWVGHLTHLQPGDVLVFEEVKGADTGIAPDADPAHRHAVRLTSVVLTEDLLGGRFLDPPTDDPVPVTRIEWAAEDALPFPFCISTVLDGDLIEDLTIARGNVALADHGRTLPEEALPDATGDRFYRPPLRETGITHCEAYDPTRAASAVVNQDPREALPAARLHGTDGVTWYPRRDLLDSDRFDTDFVVEQEDDGRAQLRFGDNEFGQMPPTDVQRKATYRVGNGAGGNVGAGAIAHLVMDVSGVTCVWNPLPARGGLDPESLDEVRLYAPRAFRKQERAVTEADYAEVTERHAEVQKAVATRRWTGSWHTMFITVDRKGGRPVDAAFEDELREWVARFELAGHDVEIDAPRFVPLDLALSVCVAPNYFAADVKEALLALFSNRNLPGGQRGFFHPDNLTFGQRIYLSRIIAAAMQVPGVRWVEAVRFHRWGRLPNDEIENGVVELGRLEIARLDNDPNAPENGKLAFIMEGGL